MIGPAVTAEPQRRFGFGANWQRYLERVDDTRLDAARASLCADLGVTDLTGRGFLDIGSGSGVFSLAARQLGARVHSFDYDPASVAATSSLRARHAPEDDGWTVERGSVLDEAYMARLGTFDIVYAWGVLHHTGSLWRALELTCARVAPGGTLCIALYNDQGAVSSYWNAVKRLYNANPVARALVTLAHLPYPFAARALVRTVVRREPLGRGMSLWHDYIDWIGGYPFEVARPERVTALLRQRGFVPALVRTCGRRSGCNEFVAHRGEAADGHG